MGSWLNMDLIGLTYCISSLILFSTQFATLFLLNGKFPFKRCWRFIFPQIQQELSTDDVISLHHSTFKTAFFHISEPLETPLSSKTTE